MANIELQGNQYLNVPYVDLPTTDQSTARFWEDVLKMGTMRNDAELVQIHRSSRPDVAFTRLWTRKEAVLKCSGQGIPSQAELRNILLSNSLPLVTVESPDLRYVYSICSSSIASI